MTTTTPKRRTTKPKEDKPKMYLVQTPEMKRQKTLAFKQSFFNRNLPLTVEMIGKYFSVTITANAPASWAL